MAVAVLLVTESALLAWAQPVEFEVATVKVNRTDSSDARFPELRNGTLVAENVSLRSLVSAAYALSPQRIIGPNWLDSDRFVFPLSQEILKFRFHFISPFIVSCHL
jgi:hypothetical protein